MKKLTFTLAVVLISLMACNNKKNKEIGDYQLTQTKWKLIGFVDATSVTPKTPQPDTDECYWIVFNKNKTLYGKSSTNELNGKYLLENDTKKIEIKELGGTKINEVLDGEMFVNRLMQIQQLSIHGDSLKLFYNEEDYLLFKKS